MKTACNAFCVHCNADDTRRLLLRKRAAGLCCTSVMGSAVAELRNRSQRVWSG